MNNDLTTYIVGAAAFFIFVLIISLFFFIIRYVFTKKKFSFIDVLAAPFEALAHSVVALIRLF